MTTSIKLPQKLVLWGHSLVDYQEMFALQDEDLKKDILDCYPGAATFNTELSKQQHGNIVSFDELYKHEQEDLDDYLQQVFDVMVARIRKHTDRFVWDRVDSLDKFADARQAGVQQFLADYSQGKKEERYIADDITATHFNDREFDLALCSHFLFGLRDEHDLDYHLAVLEELCRVSNEVRIFPLIDSKGDISPLVGPVLLALQQQNLGVEVREVPYQFQQNGNAMMRIWAHSCDL